jgi:antitoxin component of MazEF toxin-antitoxin module
VSQGEGRTVVQRRITANGNSLTITLPWPFVRELHVERGHLVVMELDVEHRAISLTPFIDVSDVDRTRWKIEGAIVASRKVMAFGNSLSVAIPRQFLHALVMFTGDRLLVRLRDDRRALVLRPLTQRSTGPTPPRCAPGVAVYGK